MLQHNKWRQCATTDILEAARAGEEMVKEWKGDKLCSVDHFRNFLPWFDYVDTYLSWDLDLENLAAVDSVKQKLEQDGTSCWMSLKDRSKEKCERLVDHARTIIVFLTERYLRMLDEDTTVKVEFEKLARLGFGYRKVFVALEPGVRKKELSSALAEKLDLPNPPRILNFSTIKARNKNFADFVSSMVKADRRF